MIWRHTFTQVQLVFDPIDCYAAERRVFGSQPHPIGRTRFFVRLKPNDWELKRAVQLITKQNSAGLHLFYGDVRLPDNTLRQHYLNGDFELLATNPYYQTVKLRVTLPAQKPKNPDMLRREIRPLLLEFQPGPTYPFPRIPLQQGPTLLRGQVVHEVPQSPGTGGKPLIRGVAGVRVVAAISGHSLNFRYTNRTGQWLFVLPDGLPSGSHTIVFTLLRAGQPGNQQERTLTILPGQDNSVKSLYWTA
jgi:hypothetical protein